MAMKFQKKERKGCILRSCWDTCDFYFLLSASWYGWKNFIFKPFFNVLLDQICFARITLSHEILSPWTSRACSCYSTLIRDILREGRRTLWSEKGGWIRIRKWRWRRQSKHERKFPQAFGTMLFQFFFFFIAEKLLTSFYYWFFFCSGWGWEDKEGPEKAFEG